MSATCPNCGAALPDNAANCTYCGMVFSQPTYAATGSSAMNQNGYGAYDPNAGAYAQQAAAYDPNAGGYAQQTAAYGAGANGYAQNMYNANPAFQNAAMQAPAAPQNHPVVNVYNQMPSSAVRLKTDRSMIVYILLSLVTLSIYNLYFMSVLGSDVNLVCSKRDGKRQMHFLVATWLLGGITLGIVPLVWMTTLCSRIGDEARARGIQTNFGGATFWLWNVLGSLIIVGPFVFLHKLCTTMNAVCEDYNAKGY